ncbi:MAG: trypsin-like peptidase domain-containing protein [Phycisphaerales bacterium]|nr:trypsin-like peptidase domain-containing protein [Phycisphaerales bacterium]
MRRFVSYGPAFVVLLTVLAAFIAVPVLSGRGATAASLARVSLARQTLDDDDILARLDAAMTALADAVFPSVIHIDVVGGRQGSSGSGWLYDDRGHVVTNAHVVRGARQIRAEFFDGRRTSAQTVAIDPFTDIAVLKLESTDGLVPARRATGEIPHRGQAAFAFGSPFGFKFSMTRGIVSGLGREPSTAVEFGGYTNFVQTDAAINPGNSGGPLVDRLGRVIGMNTAIATGRDTQGTRDGQSSGISFAVPLATIESVVDQLIERGSVSRGFFGIRMGGRVEVNEASFRGTGVLVDTVVEGGPADLAGLRRRDTIVEIAGQNISTSEQLRGIVSSFRPGQRVPVRAFRGREPFSAEVVVGEMAPEQLATQAVGSALGTWFIQLEINDSPEGPVVGATVGDVPRAAGFDTGQRIVAINGSPVDTFARMCVHLVDEGFLSGDLIRFTVEKPGGERATLNLSLDPRNWESQP